MTSTIDSSTSEEIPLPQYDSDTIKKVVDFCELVQYKNDVPYPSQIKEGDKLEDVIKNDKEREFITKLSEKELHSLVILANFLNIKRLFELCCVRMAYFFRAKEKNIEKTFGVPVAINEDIELAMKEQYHWAFEIDQDRLAQLKTQDELEKNIAPAAK